MAVGQIGKGPLVQQFGFEGAMEAFVFAQGLGVRGPGMTQGNAQADGQTVKGVKGLRVSGTPHGGPLSINMRWGKP